MLQIVEVNQFYFSQLIPNIFLFVFDLKMDLYNKRQKLYFLTNLSTHQIKLINWNAKTFFGLSNKFRGIYLLRISLKLLLIDFYEFYYQKVS